MYIKYLIITFIFLPISIMAKEATEKIDELSFFQIIKPLAIVLVLLLALAWLSKKIQKMQHKPTSNEGINIITNISLGNQNRLCLIRIDNKDILLGVTNQTITKLHECDDLTQLTEPTKIKQNNINLFQKYLQKHNNKSE